MTTIGFIGAGNIGQAVARLAIDHRYDVVLSSSRGPETLEEGGRPRPARGSGHRSGRAERGDLVVTPPGYGPRLDVDAMLEALDAARR